MSKTSGFTLWCNQHGGGSNHGGGSLASVVIATVTAYLLLFSVHSARVCCGQELTDADSTQPVIYARSGDIVTLPCNQSLPTSSSTLPFIPYIFQWHRQDLPYPFYIGFGSYPPYVDPQYAQRVEIGDDLSLRIAGVLPEDDGWYECQVIVLTGSYDNIGNGTFVHLIIVGPPRFLSTPPALVVFYANQPDRLQCVAKGTPTPTVTWLKDDIPVASNRVRTTVNAIEFEEVHHEDSGTYVCKAESDEGAVQHTVRVLVHGAPFIFIPPLNITVVQGQTAIFECEAEASPSNMTQHWYYGSEIITESGRFEFLPEAGLAVQDVRQSDEGWYSCSPSNGLGIPPVAKGYLDVQYPAFVESMPARAFISRGLAVTLTCPASSDPPLLNVKWYREGSEIIVRRSNRYRISDEGSLTISDTELDDSGSYACAPYNKIGTAGVSSPTVLTVSDPPEFIIRPDPLYRRILGEEVMITCTATGDPMPVISWRKVKGQLPTSRAIVSQNSLTIQDLSKDDHGAYQCLATNTIATIVSHTQLFVELTSPHEPDIVTVVTTISSAFVAWQPGYNGGFLQSFTVWSRQATITEQIWSRSDQIPENVNSHIMNSLQPSTQYQFAVIASNQMGNSPLSEIVLATTKDSEDIVSPTDETGRTVIPIYFGLTPSPPQNLTIVPTLEGLLLAWYPPFLWAQFINRYSIEYRLTDGPWVVLYDRVAGDTLNQLLERLLSNTTYEFRMFAFTPLLYSAPSHVVTGFTGDIPAYIRPIPTTERTPQYMEPGILAGVIAAICFLLIALLLSLLAIAVSHRRKKKKRLAFFSVAAQTPQPLIHRTQPTQSPETTTPVSAKPPSIISKIIVKISPKHTAKSAAASAPYPPRRQTHLTSNGKLPNSQSEPSLSERLLQHSSRHSTRQFKEGDLHRPRARSAGREPSKRLVSEQALELDEFPRPFSASRVYSVRDGRVQMQDTSGNSGSRHYRLHGQQHMNASWVYRDDDDSDAPPDINIPPGLPPLDPDSTHSGDYVYYHGDMFITGSSDDNEDYGWVNREGANHIEGRDYDGGLVNPALVVDDHGAPATVRTRPGQNRYVDMPSRSTWRWDQEWADDTLSHSHWEPMPRQSTKKDVWHLSEEDGRSRDEMDYKSPWTDTLSPIRGDPFHDQQDYADSDYMYGEPRCTKQNLDKFGNEYGGADKSKHSPYRNISPHRKHQSPDYETLGKSFNETPNFSPSYRKPRTSRSPGRRLDSCHEDPQESEGLHHHHSKHQDRLKRPQSLEDSFDISDKTGTSWDDQRSSFKVNQSPESERYRKPAEQVRKPSPKRSQPRSKEWTDVDSVVECDRGGTSAESYADIDTLQGTLWDTDRTIMNYHDDERLPVYNGIVSPSESARQKKSPSASPAQSGSKPEICERVSPQGGSRSDFYADIPATESTCIKYPEPFEPSYGTGLEINTTTPQSSEGSVHVSASPTALTTSHSRASVSSVDSRPGSMKPLPLPQAYISAHQRSLLSPNSQYSAASSSGYASRNTSRGRTSSSPSIHDPTSATALFPDGVDSPFSDTADPFSNVSSKQSEEPYFEYDPMLYETDLMDALKRYYEPVEIPGLKEETYEEETGKVADMKRRCEGLKKEFQEYQRQQQATTTKRRRSRMTSSV